MERQRGGGPFEGRGRMACAGCSFVGSYDARSPTLHCKYGRGSPGFLEPDPIGSASTANLDLSLSIGPLIPRTRFIDCRLKTPAKPISRCASPFVSFLFSSFFFASFSPLFLSLFLFSIFFPRGFSLFYSAHHFCKHLHDTSLLSNDVKIT